MSEITIKMTLEASRDKMISAWQLHQEQITEQMTKGIEKAVKEFDFEAEVASQCH